MSIVDTINITSATFQDYTLQLANLNSDAHKIVLLVQPENMGNFNLGYNNLFIDQINVVETVPSAINTGASIFVNDRNTSVIDELAIFTTTSIIEGDITEDEERIVDLRDIIIIPNPTKGRIELLNLPLTSNYEVRNAYGIVLASSITQNELNISDYPAGTYFLTVLNANQYVTIRVIKVD